MDEREHEAAKQVNGVLGAQYEVNGNPETGAGMLAFVASCNPRLLGEMPRLLVGDTWSFLYETTEPQPLDVVCACGQGRATAVIKRVR